MSCGYRCSGSGLLSAESLLCAELSEAENGHNAAETEFELGDGVAYP